MFNPDTKFPSSTPTSLKTSTLVELSNNFVLVPPPPTGLVVEIHLQFQLQLWLRLKLHLKLIWYQKKSAGSKNIKNASPNPQYKIEQLDTKYHHYMENIVKGNFTNQNLYLFFRSSSFFDIFFIFGFVFISFVIFNFGIV